MRSVSCIDENLALQFVSGLLDGEAARSVEAHVSECAACRWLLSAAGTAMLDDHSGWVDAVTGCHSRGSSPRTAGEVLNHTYVLERFIGKGGMGRVYQAAHLRLPRRFALKFLSEGGQAEKSAIERLRREAEVTSQLAHPHIVEVFDFNFTPDGVPFLVMELLQGESLQSRLQGQGAITDPGLFMTVVREICSALVAVHQQGIVHRDLKPTNIFLCEREGRTDFVKVMDFGISKILGAGNELTSTAAVMGSPSYMAPEQATSGAPVDQRADIFALGAIMFRMLAGRPPFTGYSVPAVMFNLVYAEPEPTPAWLEAPESIREVVLRALAKPPEQRPADVRELWGQLVQAFGAAGWEAPSGSLGAVAGAGSPGVVLPLFAHLPGSEGAGLDPDLELSSGQPSRRARSRRAPWPLLLSLMVLLFAGTAGVVWWFLPEQGGADQILPRAVEPIRDAAPPPAIVSTPLLDAGSASVSRPPATLGGPDAAAPSRRPRRRPVRTGELIIQTRAIADGAHLWAEVLLDGKLIGRTPLTLRSLPAGQHQIEVRRDGYARVVRTVRVVGGKQRAVSFEMRRGN